MTNAIIFLYTGQHPDQETIRKMAESLLQSGTSVDVNSLQNFNLEEKEIAQAIALFGIKASDDNDVHVSVSERSDLFELTESEYKALRYIFTKYQTILCKETIDCDIIKNTILSEYISACILGQDEVLQLSMKIVADAIKTKKLRVLKALHHMRGIRNLKESKDIVEILEEIYNLTCQGHIAG